MRLAVISDVHANFPALEAVLRDAAAQAAERVVCLGDVVGYSVFAKETIGLLEGRGIVTVRGNHDLMAAGLAEPVRCGPNAKAAIYWTRGVLDEREQRYLASCPESVLIGPDMLLVHSTLGNPWPYLRNLEQYREQFAVVRGTHPEVSVCFTGHTHRGGIVEVDRDGAARALPRKGTRLLSDSFYFLNPGSVGHPRGEDYRASYVMFDPNTREIAFRKIRYDRRVTDRANREHGINTNLGPSVVRERYSRTRRTLRSLAKHLLGRGR